MAQVIKIKRGTRAQLNTAASANSLAAGEPYLITDENRLAVGLSVSTYAEYALATHLLGANAYFAKTDPATVAFAKTGDGTAQTSQAFDVEVNGRALRVAASTSITMPTLTAGTDYAIWCKTDGSLEASSNFVTPPASNARKIGGFHYAAGGNATAQSGGDTTPSINAYSFWDLYWRPACPDPRGMALVAERFWADIYLLNTDPTTNGTSKNNVALAHNNSPPIIPALVGGNGSTTYGTLTWFEAAEIGAAFGKRFLTQQEFMLAAYGVTEAQSRSGGDTNYAPDKTGIGTSTNNPSRTGSYYPDQYFTSKWGLIQATGCMWVFADERGGAYYTSGFNANTEGRGSAYNAPNVGLLGGGFSNGVGCGSRSSSWGTGASVGNINVGVRYASEHVRLG